MTEYVPDPWVHFGDTFVRLSNVAALDWRFTPRADWALVMTPNVGEPRQVGSYPSEAQAREYAQRMVRRLGGFVWTP